MQRTVDGILDDIGIAFLGADLVGGPIRDWALATGGPGATLVGGSQVGLAAAVAANAQLAFDTNFNETGPGHHILSLLVQAALGAGENGGRSGRDIITAVALGYQLSGALQAAVLPQHRGDGVWSKRQMALAVAAVTGKLLGLNADQLNQALGFAWFTTPISSDGLMRQRWWKRVGMYHLGTATAGVQAALLAQHGVDGPVDALDHGAYYDLQQLSDFPGDYRQITTRMHLKPWIGARNTHPGIQAVLEVIRDQAIDPAAIESIKVYDRPSFLVYPFNNPTPTEFWDAVHSIQWCHTMAILGFEPGRAWLTPNRLKDPVALALAAKIHIVPDTEAGKVYQAGKYISDDYDDYPYQVEVSAGGRTHPHAVTRRQTPGSPDRPLTQPHLERKFLANVIPMIGEVQARSLHGRLRGLAEVRDVRSITSEYGRLDGSGSAD